MHKLTLISIQKRLFKQKITIFSVQDFARIFKINPQTARVYLSRNTNKGNFIKIKRGSYSFSLNPPSKFEIANYLLKPSYISFETALSYYKIIPETVYSITSATTSRPREFIVQNQSYEFYKIKKNLFFGYQPIKIRGIVILMATPEKALLDYLYLLSLKKGMVNERLDLSKINKERLGKHVNYFIKNIKKNKALIKLIEKIYDIKTIYK